MPAHFSITQSLWNSSVHQFDWLRLRYPLNEGKFSKISFNIFFGRKFFRCFTLFPIFGWYCCCCCFYCCYIFRVIANSNAFQRLLIRYWMNVLWNVHFFFCSRLDRSAFYSLPEKRKKMLVWWYRLCIRMYHQPKRQYNAKLPTFNMLFSFVCDGFSTWNAVFKKKSI